MSTTSTLYAFIPRISVDETEESITRKIDALALGKMVHVDIRKRLNIQTQLFAFAFMEVELYDTPVAKLVQYNMDRYGYYRLYYDSNNHLYWELKSYISRNERDSEEQIEMENIQRLCHELAYIR